MWLLMALGLAVVVRIMLPVWRARGDPLSRTLTFEIGVRPSGPNGSWTGRDHLRNGLLGLLNTAICVGLAMVAGRIEDRTMARAPFTKPWSMDGGTA